MQPKDLNDGKVSKGTQRAQLARLIFRLQREEEKWLEPDILFDRDPPINSERSEERASRRAILYCALLLLLLPTAFALTLSWPNLHRPKFPDWKPAFALAEVARGKGEFYEAKGLYSQAGRLAARSDDWAGLLAAACGLDKLERKATRYSTRDSFLLRAAAAAEKKKSRVGLTAVTTAFTSLGEHDLASAARSKVRQNWPAEDRAPAEVTLSDCWTHIPDHEMDLTGE